MKYRAAILLWMTAPVCACVDLSPVRYVEMDAETNHDPDAGDDDSGAIDGSTGFDGEACDACRATSCAMAVQVCDANPKCGAYAACMTETNCWNERIIDFSNPPACLSDCGMVAGLMSQVDPAIGLFIGVLACAQNQCAPVCAPAFLPP